MKVLTAISLADGREPETMAHSPVNRAKPRTLRTRRFGPPQVLIARLPSSIPQPAIDRIVPSTLTEAKERIRGEPSTSTMPVRKFVMAKKISRLRSPGRAVIYDHPYAASRKREALRVSPSGGTGDLGIRTSSSIKTAKRNVR